MEQQHKTDEMRGEYKTRARTIFRVEKNKDNPFVMIDRRVIENPKLSWKAKGLLAYLLSRPDNWVVHFKDLVKRAPDGAHTVRVAMNELKKAGHVRITTEREDGHIKQWVYEIHEVALLSEFQQVGFQQVENLLVENLTLNNTESFNESELNEKERDDREIFNALSDLTGGGLNSETPTMVDIWKEKHSLYWILRAVGIAKTKGARSPKYVDSILVGWEANGYPKTRDQRVAEKKNGKANVDIDPSKYLTGEFAEFVEH